MLALDNTTMAGMALGIIRTCWDPENEMSPKVIIRVPDGRVDVVDLGDLLGPMKPTEKYRLLLGILLQHRARAAAMTMPTWGVDADQRQPGLEVKDHACREEFALVLAHEGDGQVSCLRARILRDEGGLAHLGSWAIEGAGRATGAIPRALVEGVLLATAARR